MSENDFVGAAAVPDRVLDELAEVLIEEQPRVRPRRRSTGRRRVHEAQLTFF